MTARKQRLEPRKPPVQKRSKATVDEIISAAARVFEAHGYAAGTTNRIAEWAGVSIGTLYQYFPSKEAIAVSLLERHIADTDQRIHEWVGHMVSEQHGLRAALHDYVTGMLEMHSGRPRLLHILFEETPLPERVHRALLEAERRAAKTIAGLLRLYPEIRHIHLDLAGFLVVQTVESLTHRFVAHPDERFIRRTGFVDEVVTMLVAYLTYEAHARGGERGKSHHGDRHEGDND
jgi:AcrR family transcriptional regulator